MASQPSTLAIPDRALVAGRWIAAFVGIISSLPAAERADKSLAYASACIVGLATWRTIQPFDRLSTSNRRIWLAFEVLTTAVAVGLSGAWNSPFTSSLIVVAVLAALAEDLAGAWLALLAIMVSVVLSGSVSNADELVGAEFGRLFTPIVVAAVVAVAVRRGFARLRTEALTQDLELQRLVDTNSLMVRLTKLTRIGETIRDPRDIAVEAASRFAVSFRSESTTVLQRNDAEDTWTVLARHQGTDASPSPTPLPAGHAIDDLLPILQSVATAHLPGDTDPIPGPLGFVSDGRATLLAPLTLRNELIGAVVLERAIPDFSPQERRQLASMSEVLSLSIDNSRWFRRLRSMGAEDERGRIAREVHDRLGSSVAYSAFTFERLRLHYPDDNELAKAHDEARTTVSELRDLLWQLRTGVTRTSPFRVVGVDLANRFSSRTGVQATFSSSQTARLPPAIEIELLRITQEALNNIEKHADASEVSITYEPSAPTTRLRITDDGKGFDTGGARSADAYGLSGIRERADAIGATVKIVSRSDGPSSGTEITLELPTEAALLKFHEPAALSDPAADPAHDTDPAHDATRELPIEPNGPPVDHGKRVISQLP